MRFALVTKFFICIICEENLNKNAKYRIFTTEVYSNVLRKEEIIRTSVFNKFNHKLYEELDQVEQQIRHKKLRLLPPLHLRFCEILSLYKFIVPSYL